MQVNIRQMSIKNCPDYLCNDNMTVTIKDFDSGLLSFKVINYHLKVFLVLIFTILNTFLQKVLIV